MPELPEVETVRRGLEQKLNNFIISNVEVCRDSTVAYPINKQEFIEGLQGSLIYKWGRRGKYLIAELKKFKNNNIQIISEESLRCNGYLIVHLRMTGYFKLTNNSSKPCKHTRIRIFDNKNNELRYIDLRSFGQMWWVQEGLSPNDVIKGLGSLGPEPFSENFDINYLNKVITKRKKSIKSILLDQKIIAGIGNIYADESLFAAGISPFREANKIKKILVVLVTFCEKNPGLARLLTREAFSVDETSLDERIKLLMSKIELQIKQNYDKIDLHKHTIDDIVLTSDSKKKMYRESDLIDVWFDSGAMPYAQWHYPFENKNYIDDKKFFPADYIAEGVDQTRGWFYTLHVIGTLVFNSNSYKNVISNGLVLDKNGQKMSKRLGNAVDPFETLDKFGPDATRWYMISNSNPWDNLKFDVSGIEEVRRKFFGTLHNIYSFFSLYANIDEFKNEEKIIDYKERCELDRWIISELNTLVKEVNDAYENYEPTKSARLISKFVQDNLSNWYVRLSRRRFWKGEYNTDKIAAFQTLLECLKTVSILSSPISPFFMDNLFQDLTMNNESVHLTDFPNYSESLINKELQTKIRKSQEICSLALSLRKKEKIKVRQPLNKIIIPYRNDLEKESLIDISEFIKSEINVKNVELVGDSSKILVKKAKPNFKLLGPKFGKDLKIVSSIINNLKSAEIEKIENEKALVLENNIEILLEDIEIYFEDIEGWQVVSENGTTIALDTNINEELKNEGIAREIVNRIQNFRKDSGFNVSDKIIIEIENNNLIEKAIFENIDYIKNETLAVDLNFKQTLINAQEFEFDNLNINKNF